MCKIRLKYMDANSEIRLNPVGVIMLKIFFNFENYFSWTEYCDLH